MTWSPVAASFCAFFFTNWTANLLVGSILMRLPRTDMLELALKWAFPQAVVSFIAVGLLWTTECCRAASNTVPVRRAVQATASALWFVTVPFLVLIVMTSVFDVREAIGLTPRNSHLWQAALWMMALAGASKAIQQECKAPEAFAALFAFAGYGVLVVMRITGIF